MNNEENYFLIDQRIINNHDGLMFNLYGKNYLEDELTLVYEKGVTKTDDILDCRYLYAREDNRYLYEGHYNNFTNNKMIPEDMKVFYNSISGNISALFENPESVENIKEAKKIISNMVNIIMQDSFTVSSLVTILSFDYYNHTHSLNVSVYSICVGKQMGLSKKELEDLGTSALLHDLGKTKIDPAIINKNGTLTEEEFAEVQNHPFYGWLLAKKVGIENKNILAGIRNHHEKMDGSGYPDKLKNDEIHLYAKIIGVCDIFDAITTNKSYQDSKSTFETLIMMKKEMSKHLDVKIINHFINIFK
jgi:HD-GYP domain-containing protein (c-di-GMP phosphodiesterase class II)